MKETKDSHKIYINFDEVKELLGGEKDHLKRFCEAGILSFIRFKDEYSNYLINRELDNLQETGHRIKPVGQLLSVEEINNEYERAKQLLINEKDDLALKKSVEKIEKISNEIISQFEDKIKTL